MKGGGKSVCMKYWREKTMHNRVWVEGVLFHLFVHFLWNIFLLHRVKTFTHCNTSHCCFQCEKWNRQMMRSEWTRERREVVFSIGILWKQTRRGFFRPTDKKGRVDFSNRFVRCFLLSCWLCLVQGRDGEKAKEERAFPYFPFGQSFHCRVRVVFHSVFCGMYLCHFFVDWDVLCAVIRFIKQKIKNIFVVKQIFSKKKKEAILVSSFPFTHPFFPFVSISCISTIWISLPVFSMPRREKPHHTHHSSVVWVWRWRNRFRGMLLLWWMSSANVQWTTHTVLNHAVCPLPMWSTYPCDSSSLLLFSSPVCEPQRDEVEEDDEWTWGKKNGTSSAQVNSERWIWTEMMYFVRYFCVLYKTDSIERELFKNG